MSSSCLVVEIGVEIVQWRQITGSWLAEMELVPVHATKSSGSTVLCHHHSHPPQGTPRVGSSHLVRLSEAAECFIGINLRTHQPSYPAADLHCLFTVPSAALHSLTWH